jgi:hypothetical protein
MLFLRRKILPHHWRQPSRFRRLVRRRLGRHPILDHRTAEYRTCASGIRSAKTITKDFAHRGGQKRTRIFSPENKKRLFIEKNAFIFTVACSKPVATLPADTPSH